MCRVVITFEGKVGEKDGERGLGSILNYVVREVSPEITCEQKTEGEGSEPCGDLKEEYSGQREQRVQRL